MPPRTPPRRHRDWTWPGRRWPPRGPRHAGADWCRDGPRSGPATRRPGARRGSTRRAVTEARSGAHPDERDPQLLAAALDRLLAERGWETDAAVGAVLGRWPAIVGPELAAHCDAAVVRRRRAGGAGRLHRLGHPAAAARPRTASRRLNAELGAGTVTAVTVRGPGRRPGSAGRSRASAAAARATRTAEPAAHRAAPVTAWGRGPTPAWGTHDRDGSRASPGLAGGRFCGPQTGRMRRSNASPGADRRPRWPPPGGRRLPARRRKVLV